VGTPTVCTCVKLRDWPEGGYKLSDADDPAIGMPRGEILIGGSMVCQGYLVDPNDPDPDVVAKNKTEFVTEHGMRFFCSGDIGQVTPEGTIMIIDRKKDLVKLQQGEYVALSKVEGVLKLCPVVEYPMVYAESTKDYCVALVCPNHGMLKNLAKTMGIEETDVAKLCDNQEVVMEVSKLCAAACKKGKLVGFEIPWKIALVADTFTPENDCLTAAMKLKRPVAYKIHEKLIKSIYP
jgi:long-subunit acyl-CoA synthetase (AMP-forming)